MPKLDNAVKNNLRILENEVGKNLRVLIKVGSLFGWKRRKIISVKEWVAMAQRYDKRHKWLQFMPDNFVEPLFYHQAEDKQERAKWHQDFEEYLNFKKDPTYGKFLCRFCILNQSPKLASTGLRDLFLKYLRNVPEYKFPCTVVNRFECPYEQGGKVRLLLNLGSCWLILDEALGYARILPSKEDTTIEADFEAGLADNYHYRSRKKHPRYNLEKYLGEYRFARIPVKLNEGIYQIMIDKEKLDFILEQYIEYLEGGGYSPHGVNGKSKDDAIFLRKLKNIIVDFMTDIKDEIILENLGDIFWQVTNSVDFSHNAGLVPTSIGIGMPPPEDEIFVKSGSCYSCGQFANIHCVNCDIWICTDHWRQHGTEQHNYTEKLDNSKLQSEMAL